MPPNGGSPLLLALTKNCTLSAFSSISVWRPPLEDRGQPGGIDVAARDDAHDPPLACPAGERRRDGEGSRALGDHASTLGQRSHSVGGLVERKCDAPGQQGMGAIPHRPE